MKELPTITIAQYAGIRVAVAEGFDLDAVLAQEGVPDWRWPALDRELADAVASDPALFAELETRTLEAEDHLYREVRPVAADLAAWVGLLHGLASEPTLTNKLNLNTNNIKQLKHH